MSQRQIKFYKTEKNECLVEDFLDTLTDKVVEKITWTLRIIRDEQRISHRFLKKLTNTDIWEIRIEIFSDIYRIFCFFDAGNLVILTHGFQKKTQKTPKAEIDRAEKYRKDYLRRKKDG